MRIEISIIMPVYNAELYLNQAIDSLLFQGFNDFEIICVDDGSTDSSVEIIKNYVKKDDRIKLIRQKNQFAGVARNNGLKIATGKYVLFLDADDFFERDMLKNIYQKAEETQSDICLFNARRYKNDVNEYEEAPWYLKTQFIPDGLSFSPDMVSHYIFNIVTPAPWNKLFLREFIIKNNLSFQNLKRSNYLFFTYSALSLANRISVVDKCLVNYRIGITTNLQSNNEETPLDFFLALKELKIFLLKNNLYKKYAVSYDSLAVSVCAYNIKSIKNEEKKEQLQCICKYRIFRELKLLHKKESDFNMKWLFEEYQNIIKSNYKQDKKIIDECKDEIDGFTRLYVKILLTISGLITLIVRK